jgi:hypothetical protein
MKKVGIQMLISTFARIKAIAYRCEDGLFLISATRLTISKPDLVQAVKWGLMLG